MKRLLTVGLLMLLAMNAPALEPDDYAYGNPLTTDGSKPIYQLPLPASVYQQTVYPDLNDVQVFNAAGESLPYSLHLPAAADSQKKELSLPFFPIETAVETAASDKALQIELNDDGRIAAITSSTRTGAATQTSYIIDVRDLNGAIEQLQFDLSADSATYVQRFALDTGTDLNHWHPLQRQATLAQLQHGDQMLERSTLTLTQQPSHYLRLRWLGEEVVSLQGVTAIINSTVASRGTHQYRWRNVEGQSDTEKNNVFYYDLDAHYPISRINLRLPDINTLASAHFASRPDADSPWRARGEFRVYRLQAEGMTVHNEALPIDRRTDRYWRVTLNNAGTLNSAPQLRVGWLPQQLVFLARGEEPYVLAYGRADNNASVESHQLVHTPEQALLMGEAQAGELFVLGGESRLQASREPPNWRQIILWTVLLIAVAILGIMALRLFRDMEGRQ